MSPPVVLESVELVPVLEVEPQRFATRDRAWPPGSRYELPDEWHRYWLDSLADAGVVGLEPLAPGSDHVPTAALAAPVLETVLRAVIGHWSGVETLSDPDGDPVLNGGLALRRPGGPVLVEPGCCSDLRTLSDWREAAGYRGAGWKVVWIGHPWVSVRYQEPWLVLSQRHEGEDPADRWAVRSDELRRAVAAAGAELGRFVACLAALLPALGYREAPEPMARRLAGLTG